MAHHFHVNVGTAWSFEIEDSHLVHASNGLGEAPRTDSLHLVRDAMARPTGFPSLARASVPGDRIVVAVDPLLPDAAAALRGVADGLIQAGADAAAVTFVLPTSLAGVARELSDVLQADAPFMLQTAVHDPANRAELAYLAATEDAHPVYLNRLLCDADLLIPLTCVPPPTSPRWLGIHGSIYPWLSDAETIDRFRVPLGSLTSTQHEQRRQEVDEVGWLLGVCVVVGIVPGPNGSILRAIAGTPDRVGAECQDAARSYWDVELPRRVPLVITLVGDRDGELSWDDFAAAMASARNAAGDEAAVAICGNFTRLPGRSLHRLAGASDLQAVQRRLHRDQHEDTWAAQELATALLRGPVYFAGGLNEDQVEELGMAPIQQPEEIARLASRFEECVVIRDAHIAAPHLAGETRPAA